MTRLLLALLVVGLPAWVAPPAEAQTPGDVFRKVAPSVVVIRAKGRDIGAGGQSRFAETGSGVLITPDGKVMTAAHVVHAMDEISVEFLGGETVKAHVVASEPAADLSLLQLARVPLAVRHRQRIQDESLLSGSRVGGVRIQPSAQENDRLHTPRAVGDQMNLCNCSCRRAGR